jgi:gentisate 1,2-dioxygenase
LIASPPQRIAKVWEKKRAMAKDRKDLKERKERLAKVNHWDELLALRDRQREQTKNAIQVVKESELPLEVNRQGLMRWYLHPSIKDTALSVMLFFQQEIPPGSRSGRLKFQGGQVMMILEGKGYTTIDGVKHHWQAGDVVNLPLRSDGIIVQHFNTDPDNPAKFIAAEPNWVEATTVDRGSGFEQLEDAPEYKR